jgi:hypothetical protein
MLDLVLSIERYALLGESAKEVLRCPCLQRGWNSNRVAYLECDLNSRHPAFQKKHGTERAVACPDRVFDLRI